MKTPLLATLLLCIAHFCFGQDVPSDSTKRTYADSVHRAVTMISVQYIPNSPREGDVYYGPAFGRNKIEDLGYYATTIRFPQLFHFSAGLSVINTLRGQVAGISITPQAMDVTLTAPGNGNLFVIDGLPYNSISDHYNLNAFEYQNISVINSGNASSRFGGGGLNSVVLLQRKNGDGVNKPRFEVNSFTTFASNKIPNAFSDESTPVDRWFFTNSVAYAQDFGAIDTRVSYSYSRFPSNEDYPIENNIHTTTLNTGLELGKRFKARLILDQFARLGNMDESSQYANANVQDSYSGKENFLQGNLSMNYELTEGLNLSSQAAMSRVKDRLARLSERTGEIGFTNVYNREYEHQQRTFLNLFLNGNNDLSGIKLNYAVGYQIEKFNPYKDSFTAQQGFDYWSAYESKTGYDINTKSLVTELGFNLGNYLSVAANYQHNDFGKETNDTYTFATSFTFAKAFHLDHGILSFGNVRANYGKADITNNATFPVAFNSDFFQTSQFPVGGTKFETGVDFGFLYNRISLSANRFYNTNDNTYMWMYVPWGPNGVQQRLFDVGETNVKGWSLIAGAKIFDHEKFRWTTKISWQTSKTEIRKNDYLPFDVVVSPGWQSGVLNEFQIKKWFVSFLIDTNYGVDNMKVSYDGFGMPFYSMEDVNQTKLRDVSVGYTLPQAKTNGPLIRISMSARNLWTIHTTADSDFENSMGTYSTLRNFSVSIGATF